MDLHTLKKQLQDHLGDGLVTIIGSGLSCAEGLPGMGELGDHLLASVGHDLTGEDQATWEAASPLIKDKGLEAALLAAPPTALVEDRIVAATAHLIAERERKVVASVFNSTTKLRLTRLLPHLVMPPNGMTIVTANYDRLVEVAVEEAGMGADTMFVGRFAGQLSERESRMSFCKSATLHRGKPMLQYRPRVLVCKPHGSLDWYLRGGRPVSYGGELRDAVRLIITPGKNKFRNGYESPFDHHRSRANEAIDRAARYLVLGYGFNDDHLETHLTPRIKEGKPTLMLTWALSDAARKLAKENPNVIALESCQIGGAAGTQVICNRHEYQFAGLSIWDVNSFVAEVLEP